MQYHKFLKTRLGNAIPSDAKIPRGFHLVGHVVLLQLDEELMNYAELIGNTTLEYDSRIRSVAVRIGPTYDTVRNPQYQLVAGDSDTVTLHVERGVKFHLDPLRVTFSGGNRTERMRISDAVKPGEVVLDMFACVGQFALHIAKTDNTEIIAIEINPIAYDFLIKNIKANSVSNNVRAILGDCRKVSPMNTVDRIVMGYLHDTFHYLPYAIQALHQDG
ncbi:MAG: class I SAM-dependent methyltransferase, partial [Candidatus Thorarchaeota archaeon]